MSAIAFDLPAQSATYVHTYADINIYLSGAFQIIVDKRPTAYT